MNNQIKVASEKLQKAINHLIEYIKEQFNLDLNNEILNEEQIEQVNEVALEVFDEYAIYNDELYAHDDGYNILEKAVELHNTDPLIVNLVLIEKSVVNADLVISTIAMPGAKANKVVSEDMVKRMRDGSVIIDISIDQGGTIATIKLTSHDHPTFVKHGVVHGAVPNIPGAVAKTATLALVNASLPYIVEIANSGIEAAVARKPELKPGINCYNGNVTLASIATALSLEASPLEF